LVLSSPSMNLNSADQSATARHKPSTSGWPDFSRRSHSARSRTHCSSCDSKSFGSNFIECSTIPIERGRLSCQILPSLHDDIHVLGIKFQSVTDALGNLSCCQRGPTARERVVNQLATHSVVQDRPTH